MSKTRFLQRMAVAAVLFGAAVVTAQAAQVTPVFRVGALQAGWVVDRMLVFPASGPLFNPDGCAIVNNGYIINENDPGHRTFYAMLLTAFVNQRNVQVIVHQCFEGRPRIISVTIR